MKNEYILQAANECLFFSNDALEGYIEHSDKVVSTQFINLASQSLKTAQTLYLQNKFGNQVQEFEDFYHQFNQFCREFLWSLEGTHNIEHAKNFLVELEKCYYVLKTTLHT